MRRLGLAVTAVCGVIAVATPVAAQPVAGAPFVAQPVAAQPVAGAPVVVGAAPVVRAPAPSATAPAGGGPGAGQPVCSITDTRLAELSGLVAVDNGYLVVNDSHEDASAKRIYRLDTQCKVAGSFAYPSTARDPEDLAMARDGTIWVADIGDNDARHENVALWKLARDGKTPVIHRVHYANGPRDAEALLVNGDGTPIIVTKELSKAGVYIPAAPLVPNNSRPGVELKRVGEVTLPDSDTPSGVPVVGHRAITGGAVSPDGRRVVLRTYADALEWDVPDGDVVKAITTGKPRKTPLPNEPQGEAITYSRDGKTFLTVSDVTGGRAAPLLRYTPAAAPAAPTQRSQVPAASGGSSGLSIDDITYLVAAVGMLGLVLVLVGVVAIRRSRRLRRAAASASAGVATGRAGVGRAATAARRPADDEEPELVPGGSAVAGRRHGATYGADRTRGTAADPVTGAPVTGAPVTGGPVIGAAGGPTAGRAPAGRAARRGAALGGADRDTDDSWGGGARDGYRDGYADPPPSGRRAVAPEQPTPGGGSRTGGRRGGVYGAPRVPAEPDEGVDPNDDQRYRRR